MSLLFGIPMLLVGIVLMVIGQKPVELANGLTNLHSGFFSPVMAFEFIRSPEEVTQFFNVPSPNAYRLEFLWVNSIDYLFMFFYATFLGFTGLGIAKETKVQVLWISVILGILVFGADMLENIIMQSIVSAHFEGKALTGSYFGNLYFFTWLKWGSLATIFLIFSGYFSSKKWFGKIISWIALFNFVIAIGAFFHRSLLNEIMGLTTMLTFVFIFIHNVRFKSTRLNQ